MRLAHIKYGVHTHQILASTGHLWHEVVHTHQTLVCPDIEGHEVWVLTHSLCWFTTPDCGPVHGHCCCAGFTAGGDVLNCNTFEVGLCAALEVRKRRTSRQGLKEARGQVL